jgi:hypothetical protein
MMLRMRDLSPGTSQNLTYYIGHPTAATPGEPTLLENYGAKIDATNVQMKTLPVYLHIIDSLATMPSIADATKLMADVSTIWSQAGRSFNVIGAAIETVIGPTQIDYAQPIYYAQGRSIGTASNVTALNQRPDAIDIYFVDKIFQRTLLSGARSPEAEINAVTFLPSIDPRLGKAGCIVAVNSSAFQPDAATKRLELVRTIAHELGHYLLVQDDDAHVGMKTWNLMKAGESTIKRSLTSAQVARVSDKDVTGIDLRDH